VKVRFPIPPDKADFLLAGQNITPVVMDLLPADLAARLNEIVGDELLIPVVCVNARRYATEEAGGEGQRFTLDTGVHTDRGECLAYHVLEFKAAKDTPPPGWPLALGLRPVKSSKFLWATREL
jgi:hypothetical protein